MVDDSEDEAQGEACGVGRAQQVNLEVPAARQTGDAQAIEMFRVNMYNLRSVRNHCTHRARVEAP